MIFINIAITVSVLKRLTMIDANIYWYTYSYNILINALQLLKLLREFSKGYWVLIIAGGS